MLCLRAAVELVAETVPVVPRMLSHPGELFACSHDVTCELLFATQEAFYYLS